MPVSDADILERAADRIARPGAWCKGDYAHDLLGRWADPKRDDACSWCLRGAIAAETPSEQDAWRVEDHVEAFLGSNEPLAEWNDRQSSAAPVVAALRETAKRLRGEQT